MSANTQWGVLRGLDVLPDQMTLHGFRAMARIALAYWPTKNTHELIEAEGMQRGS